MTPAISIVVISAVGVAAQLGAAVVNASIVALFALAIWRRREFQVPKHLGLSALAVFGISLLHAFVGEDPVSSWGYATQMRQLAVFLIVGALASQLTEKQRNCALLAALGAMVLAVLYSLYQVITETTGPLLALHPDALRWPSRNYRGSGEWLTFSINGLRGTGMVHHVLSFAHVTCMLSLAALSQLLFGTERKRLWFIFTVIGVVGIALSGARAAMVAWLLGGCLILGLRVARSWHIRRALCLGAVLTTVGGFIAVATSDGLRHRIGSFEARELIWQQGIEVVQTTFPRGLGYGAYPAYAERVYPTIPRLAPKVRAWAHNVWLSLMAEAPLVIPAFLWFLWCLIRRADRILEDQRNRAWGAMVLASLVAWLAIGLFHDSHFQREYFPFVLWLWGLGLSPGWSESASCLSGDSDQIASKSL